MWKPCGAMRHEKQTISKGWWLRAPLPQPKRNFNYLKWTRMPRTILFTGILIGHQGDGLWTELRQVSPNNFLYEINVGRHMIMKINLPGGAKKFYDHRTLRHEIMVLWIARAKWMQPFMVSIFRCRCTVQHISVSVIENNNSIFLCV